jgi:hypothetical protein
MRLWQRSWLHDGKCETGGELELGHGIHRVVQLAALLLGCVAWRGVVLTAAARSA